MIKNDDQKIKSGLTFHIPWWQFSDEDGKSLTWLADLINAKVIYEIGCWTGHSTSYLAEYAKNNCGIVNVIDTFQGNSIMKKAVGFNFFARNEFEKNMKKLNLFKYINILQGFSHSFINRTNDESIDLMFIDGDHRYSRISQDIEEWFSKIKKGGILCGHDCESKKWNENEIEVEEGVNGRHHGVIKAVFERFPEANLEHNRIWWIKK